MKKLIGTLKVTAEKNRTVYGEYAGSGEVWDLDEAEVPVYFSGYWFHGQRPGTRTDSWFQNRIGAHTSMERDQEPKKGTTGFQFDKSGAGRAVVEGRLKLDPESGFKPVRVGTYGDGRPMYSLATDEEIESRLAYIAKIDPEGTGRAVVAGKEIDLICEVVEVA